MKTTLLLLLSLLSFVIFLPYNARAVTHDVGISVLVTPLPGGVFSSETVTCLFYNYSTDYFTGTATASFSIDGGPVYSLSTSGVVLPPANYLTFDFYDIPGLSSPGIHSIKLWSTVALDADHSNDTLIVAIECYTPVTVFPYNEDFESGASTWYTGGTGNDWQLGTPSSAIINTPPPATPLSTHSWKTNLTGNYGAAENSFLLSPVFDLSSLSEVVIDFDIWWNTELLVDGIGMYYTINGGSTWTQLTHYTYQRNWFNAFTGYTLAWSGNSDGWKNAFLDISFLAGESAVQFKFTFVSDYLNFYDGVAIDNFKLHGPLADDISLWNIESPTTIKTNLTATESVSVTIKNTGTIPQSGFSLSYQVNGSPAVTETYTGSAAGGSSALYTFTTPADFSGSNSNLKCWVTNAGDEETGNDTAVSILTQMDFVTGTAAYSLAPEAYFYGDDCDLESHIFNEGMNPVFGASGWNFISYEDADVHEIFSPNTCFVWMNGTYDQARYIHWFMNQNAAIVETWVANGGKLLFTASLASMDNISLQFENTLIKRLPMFGTFGQVANDIEHEIYTGPYEPMGNFWQLDEGDPTCGLTNYTRVEGTGLDSVIIDYNIPERITLAEKQWNVGKIMVWTLEPPDLYSPVIADTFSNVLLNVLDYMSVCVRQDIYPKFETAPGSDCISTSEYISVEIKNGGYLNAAGVTVSYQVDGGSIVTETVPVDIPAPGVYNYTFSEPASFPIPGEHTIKMWTHYAGDENTDNDTLINTVYSYDLPPLIASYDYVVLGGNLVDFTNTSSGAITEYLWDFGDGMITFIPDPLHPYADAGTYSVILTITDSCSSEIYSQDIYIAPTSVHEKANDLNIAVYPVPADEFIQIAIGGMVGLNYDLSIINNTGEMVYQQDISSGISEVNIGNLSNGVYTLKVQDASSFYTTGIMILR